MDQFHCSNGKCVPDWWRCNSMDECGDNSDEELCVDSPFSFQPCSLNQFPCLSRYTRIYTCLPHSLRCDGSIDCQVTNPFTTRSRTRQHPVTVALILWDSVRLILAARDPVYYRSTGRM